jgi:hypothetical protein
MAANYGSKLRALFPDYKDGDWELSFNGQTHYLKWNRQEPEPTPAQINSVTDAQVFAAEKDRNGEERMAKLDDVTKSLIQVLAPRLGITPQTLRQELKAELKK